MGKNARQFGHARPTMSSSQRSIHRGKPDQTATRPEQNAKAPSRVRGQAPNAVTTVASDTQEDIPCNIGKDEVAKTSAHDHFRYNLGHEPAAWTKKPKSSARHDKDSAFYERVSRDYNLLIACRYSSYPLSSLIHDRFFNLDPPYAVPHHGPPSAVKIHNFGVNIQHNQWKTPPDSLSEHIPVPQPFSCTFWLTLQALPQDIRRYLTDYTCVLGGNLVFPYLTVDFRNDEEELPETRRRAACNAKQALYNRCCLYMETLKEHFEAAGALNKALHCHFIIIFDDMDCEGWHITPDQDKKWTGKGCTMKRVFSASLLGPDDLEKLHEWVNEIHHWAATKYGPACAGEIRTCLRAENATNDPAATWTDGVAQLGTLRERVCSPSKSV